MAKKNEVKKPVKKNQAFLTAFIMIFPVLILAMVGLVGDMVLRICLFFYEAILLKNFIDDYYENKNQVYS